MLEERLFIKRNWNKDELLEHFVVEPIKIGNKTGVSRLKFAVLLINFNRRLDKARLNSYYCHAKWLYPNVCV